MGKRRPEAVAFPCLRRLMGSTCGMPGVARPSLIIRAFVGEPGLELEMDVPVCAAHREGVSVPDLMDDRGWRIARKMYEAAKGSTPLRALTSVRWRVIGEAASIFDPKEASA